MHLIPLLLACSGSPAPDAPETRPAPRRTEAPKPAQMRAPLESPKAPPVDIDLDAADPMALVEAKGPGGSPLTSLSLIVASRGDGEIEPCG